MEGIPWSGWATEIIRHPEKDRRRSGLKPLQKSSLYSCAERNLMDSDGTLFFTEGTSEEMRNSLKKFAQKRNHPWFAINLNRTITFQAARESAVWIHRMSIRILNITGDSDDSLAGKYRSIHDILETTLHLIAVEQGMSGSHMTFPRKTAAESAALPKTAQEVVNLLKRKLSLRDKVRLGKMDCQELKSVYFSLGEYIRNELGIWENNQELIRSCEALARDGDQFDEDACVVIIHELWKQLKTTHLIRQVK